MAIQRCLYCSQPAQIGPHEKHGECCNHAITCPSCGKSSTLSVNLAIVGTCDVTPHEALPLLRDIA